MKASVIALWGLLVALSLHDACAQADGETTTKPVEEEQDDFDPNNRDWGSYYDPKNIFCGKFDCYKILGFDYESFGKDHPDTRKITKRFRKLSRAWHPDKSKHRDAKQRFVQIARAYEVLTNDETRREYDKLRYDQEAYFQKYGSSVLFSYAPKSDVSTVLFLVCAALLHLLIHIFSGFSGYLCSHSHSGNRQRHFVVFAEA